MTYTEAYKKIKNTLKTAKADKIEGHLAVQINLTDEDAAGILYIEVNEGKLAVEPYDYYDRDAMITVTCRDFVDVMTQKLDFDKAVEDGVMAIYGNMDRALELKKLVKKPAEKKPVSKKAATKKETVKSPVKATEKGATDKKPAAKKATKNTAAK